MVALARFKAKYPNIEFKQDPFVDYLNDEDVLMETQVPFNDSLDPPPIVK